MTTTQDPLAIANTIRAQIGNRALFMLGAKNIAGGANYLSFQIRGSKAFTHIKVTLDPSDTYTVTFYKLRKFDVLAQVEVEGIYADGLCQVMENRTGLRTSL